MKLKKLLTTFLLFALILTGCSDELKETKLATPLSSSISYDGEKISWDTVNNASGYALKINDGASSHIATTNSHAFVETKDFTVAIKALGGLTTETEKFLESDWSSTVTIRFLKQVQNLDVQQGELIWDAVEGALGYEVKIAGEADVIHVATNKYDGIVAQKSYVTEVRAVGDGKQVMDGAWSMTFSFRILDTPGNFKYDKLSNIITWSAVNDAEGYVIEVNDVPYPITPNQTSYSFIPPTTVKTHKIAIYATNTSGNNLFDSKKAVFFIERLDQISSSSIQLTNVTTNETHINFTAVSHAESYTVKVNGVEVIKQPNGFYHLFGDGDSVIELTAIAPNEVVTLYGQKYYFLDSNPVTFNVRKLIAPTNLRISEGVISWDETPSAESYEVSVSGVTYQTATTAFTLPNVASGTHEIKVRALGNNTGVITSNYSSGLNVTKLETVKVTTFSHDGYVVSWGAVAGVSSYEINVNGAIESVNTNMFTIASDEVDTTFTIAVRAKGNGSNLIDSAMSETFVLHRLDIPLNFKIDEKGMLTWNVVSSATGYVVILNGQVFTTTLTSFDTTSNIAPGEQFVIYVYAVANKTDGHLDSHRSEAVSGKRLERPVNLRIVDNYIVWDEVVNAFKYEVTFNGVVTTVTENEFHPNVTLANNNNIVTIRALASSGSVGNDWFINSTPSAEFSWSSTKLLTPTNVEITKSNDEEESAFIITWGKVNNAESYEVYVGGVVHAQTEEREYKLEYSSSGQYEVTVRAIGNYLTTVDSSLSNKKTVTVLAAPVLTTSKNSDGSYLVKWNAISGAQRYIIRKTVIENGVSEVTLISFPATQTIAPALWTESGVIYHLEIKAVGDNYEYYDSVFSKKTIITG